MDRVKENTADDWRAQLRRRWRSPAALRRRFPDWMPSAEELKAAARFAFGVTPYYGALIREPSASDPIYLLCMPSAQELVDRAFTAGDPFHEREAMPVPGLVRRYRDRALLMATSHCAVYCRHCTRKHTMGGRGVAWTDGRLAAVARYLSDHPEIREVLISGGDPLTMETGRLERLLVAVRQSPHIERVRIGTRVPVVLPMRIQPELTRMLRRHHPLWINTHFNHPAELTPEAARACARLADAGIPLGNQTVLLRGVNDRLEVLEALFTGLLRMRVRPYYLLQADPVRGTGHFRTPVRRGLELIGALRERMSGLAVPTFIVDMPGGGGKIPLLPSSYLGQEDGHAILRTGSGNTYRYPDE